MRERFGMMGTGRIALSVIATGLWTIFSIYNDLHFFNFTAYPQAMIFYILMKLLFVVFVFLLLSYLIYVISEALSQGSGRNRSRILVGFSVLLLCVYIPLMVIMYPGEWGLVSDEFLIYNAAVDLRIWGNQGTFSSIFMILGLMLFPRPAAVVLLQCLITVLTEAGILADIWLETSGGKKRCFALIVLFLSIPCLAFSMCPIRIWLFSLLILKLSASFLKFQRKAGEVTWQEWALLTALCCLIINCREEGKLLLIFFPALLWKSCQGQKIKWMVILGEGLAVISVLFFSVLTGLGQGRTLRQHAMVNFICPLSIMVSQEDIYAEIPPKDLENINKIFPVEVLKEYPSYTEMFQWKAGEGMFAEPSQKEQAAGIVSAVKLCLRYPEIYLRCKLEAAAWSLGLYPYSNVIGRVWSTEQLEAWVNGMGYLPERFLEFTHTSEMRESLSKILAGGFKIGRINGYYLVYAFWLPAAFLVLGLWTCRGRGIWLLHLYVISQFLCTVLLAPSRYNMYYLPYYLCGWFLIIMRAGKKAVKYEEVEKSE